MRHAVTVIEVGPVGVHRTGPRTGRETSPETGPETGESAVLASIDDELSIVDDQLVTVDELWTRVLDTAGDAVVVHPTWWTPNRVTRIRDAATACGIGRVTSRAQALAADAAGASWAVIEISADLVSVTRNGAAPQSWTRCSHPEDAVVAAVAGVDEVMIDVPDDVPGGRTLARALADRARCRYVSPVDVLRRAVTEAAPPGAKPRRLTPAVGMCAASIVALCAVLAAQDPGRDTTTALVEGRVGVQIPVGWHVQRVTDDAGSPRLQVFSPSNPDPVIHITQSPVGAGNVVDTLRYALDQAPVGVFVDFNAADRIADRPVITYREVRAHREVRWAVLVDGPVRIAIGCQGREHHGECAAAVASAHAAF